MAGLNNYKVNAADWRNQLRLNERRTKMVLALFVLIYLAIGMLVDLYLHSGVVQTNQGIVSIPLHDVFVSLITFQTVPWATLILGAIAVISILVTFALHDKLMLLGTEYHEIKSDTSHSLEEQQLYNVIEEMKTAAGLRYMPRVFIIEANYMNAFASGYSEKSAMIAITRGLLQKLNRAELQAVMAHELNHIRHHDIKLTLMASVLSNIMLIVVDIMFYSVIFSGGRRDRDNRLAVVIIILRFLLPFITVILMLYLSRTREYMADAGAVELTRDNTPLANALLKIQNDHQENKAEYGAEYIKTPHEDVRRAAYIFDPIQAGVEPAKSISTMFSTHPSIKDRLKALGVTIPKAIGF
ncbi:MAG: zinc metalloprotease HtpX [Gammaproteobacteria bacterium]|nr:zinc metalloprotease HtpX [Gammaproteobacteria bacterium]